MSFTRRNADRVRGTIDAQASPRGARKTGGGVTIAVVATGHWNRGASIDGPDGLWILPRYDTSRDYPSGD